MYRFSVTEVLHEHKTYATPLPPLQFFLILFIAFGAVLHIFFPPKPPKKRVDERPERPVLIPVTRYPIQFAVHAAALRRGQFLVASSSYRSTPPDSNRSIRNWRARTHGCRNGSMRDARGLADDAGRATKTGRRLTSWKKKVAHVRK